MSNTAEEEQIISKRVLLHTQDFSIDECLNEFFGFYDDLFDPNADSDGRCDEVLTKFEWYQIHAKLGQICEQTLDDDIAIYTKKKQILENSRQKIKAEIDTLKKKLTNEERKKSNIEEYDDIIAVINREHPRDQTKSALQSLKRKVNQVTIANQQCQFEIEQRHKQCYTAFSAVSALQRDLRLLDTPLATAAAANADDSNDVTMEDA